LKEPKTNLYIVNADICLITQTNEYCVILI